MSVGQKNDYENNPVQNRLKRLITALGWNARPEQEQGILRLVISVAFLSYLLLNWPNSEENLQLWQSGMQIIVGFLAYSIFLFLATLVWPQYASAHRIIGICIDIGVFSYGLHVTGPLSAPWYGVYLWVTLGNGFRYGEKYLYLSGVASLIGFGTVALTTPYWETHRQLAIGLAITLMVIPAYSAILIRRLNEAKQRADAASRAKSEFLSRMSHEIRTPLNGILGMTELLRERPLSSEDKEYVETIYASGRTLAHQIDEILDLSKIEAGQLTVEHIEFDLYALINTTLRIFEPQVSAKQVQLQETIDPRTPFLLYGDPHKLRQVIINLVGNAVKFTDQGFVSLRVYPREQEAGRVVLRFEVADTGPGIPADRLGRIFEPFTQADSSVSRSHGGTGLGTTICKHLIRLMGGKIGVQSTLNVGTTFWFDIPFESAMPQTVGSDHSWTAECHILCLEPAGQADGGILPLLREWHIPYRIVDKVSEARRFIAGAEPAAPTVDALIVDGYPYDSDLHRLLSDMASSQAFSSAAVILIDKGKYPPQIAGASHDQLFVLPDPVDRHVLFNTLHACYSRHSTEDDVIHIAHHQVKDRRISRSLNILVSDDNSTNRLVLQRMLDKMGYRTSTVDGGEAVLHALEHSRYDVVIIDKNMPDMGGLEVFQACSLAHGGKPPVKFIILTADATAESRAACEAAGIEHFLTKPVSMARLQEALVKAVTADQTDKRESRAAAGRAESDPGNLPVVDDETFDKLTLLAGDNGDFITDVIGNFETDARQDIQGLEFSVASHDLTAFRDYGHALKGAAMYLGLSRLVALATETQHMTRDVFEREGIEQVRALRQATDEALGVLRQKAQDSRRKMG